MRFFDAHCHLDHPAFDADRAALLARLRPRLSGLVIAGYDPAHFDRVVSLCDGQFVFGALGLHPHHLGDSRAALDARLAALDRALASRPRGLVAVGECGFDRNASPAARQLASAALAAQIGLAKAHRLGLVLHLVGGVDEATKLLKTNDFSRAMVHRYSGSLAQAERLFALGAVLSFGAEVLRPEAERLRAVLRVAPCGQYALESDAPFNVPRREAGPSDPGVVLELAQAAATVRGSTLATVARETRESARRVFGLCEDGDPEAPRV